MPTALGLADLSTLTLRVGTAACFPGRDIGVFPRAVIVKRIQEDADGGARAPSAPPPWVRH